MYKLEVSIHNNVSKYLNLCLKHDLGNRIVNNIFWTTEPPGIRKLQKCVPKFIKRYLAYLTVLTLFRYLFALNIFPFASLHFWEIPFGQK